MKSNWYHKNYTFILQYTKISYTLQISTSLISHAYDIIFSTTKNLRVLNIPIDPNINICSGNNKYNKNKRLFFLAHLSQNHECCLVHLILEILFSDERVDSCEPNAGPEAFGSAPIQLCYTSPISLNNLLIFRPRKLHLAWFVLSREFQWDL